MPWGTILKYGGALIGLIGALALLALAVTAFVRADAAREKATYDRGFTAGAAALAFGIEKKAHGITQQTLTTERTRAAQQTILTEKYIAETRRTFLDLIREKKDAEQFAQSPAGAVQCLPAERVQRHNEKAGAINARAAALVPLDAGSTTGTARAAAGDPADAGRISGRGERADDGTGRADRGTAAPPETRD